MPAGRKKNLQEMSSIYWLQRDRSLMLIQIVSKGKASDAEEIWRCLFLLSCLYKNNKKTRFLCK